MTNQNWNEINKNIGELGKNISEMVESAIDAEDFSKLSTAIQNTMSAAGDSINRTAEYLRKKGSMAPAQNPWKGNGKFEQKTAGHMLVKDIPHTELYSPGKSTRAGGYLLTIFGGIGCGIFGIAEITMAALMCLLGEAVGVPLVIVSMFLAASIFMTSRGLGVLGRFRRFKNYVKVLGTRTSISIKELASNVGKSEKSVRKDLCQMMEREMFLQGHLDTEGKQFFVTHQAYQEYINGQRQIEENKRKLLQQAKEAESYKTNDQLSDEVKKLIADGREYIEKIRISNEIILDEVVSAKLDDLEVIVAKIFQYVEQHPESAPETKKLMRYYLPTTMKLLDSYQKLDEQKVGGANIEKTKKEIEVALDTLNQAFARLFDNLYQDISMDVTSDISVLNTLLAQEGLTGEQIK